MMYNPITTKTPKTISRVFIFRLKKIGSNNDVKNAPVLMVTKATETLDTFIALKKATQCNAIIIPVKKNLSSDFLSTLKRFFFTRK